MIVHRFGQNIGKSVTRNILYLFDTQHTPASQTIDPPHLLTTKIDTLASLLTHSQYPIFFTGAGISTSIGIPDYRSGVNTVLRTGPGLWNRSDAFPLQPRTLNDPPIEKLVDMARPSLTHMFISTLLRKGIAKHLVSQNTDGLHLRSGVSISSISELHGNRNLEHCLRCERKYFRDFRTLRKDEKKIFKPGERRDHFTGRFCQNCQGELHDSIIYFGEKLPKQILAEAYYHAHCADLVICIGSSLTVKPSSLVPLQALKKERPARLCIINIQETPLDQLATEKISYFCDEVCQKLSQKMNLSIDSLRQEHFLLIQLKRSGCSYQLVMRGRDKKGNNLAFIQSVAVSTENQEEIESEMQGHSCKIVLQNLNQSLLIEIEHVGGAKEPFIFKLDPSSLNLSRPVELHYSKSQNQKWQFKLQS